jgi:transcriptional regulator with XRE-family HTH domain
MDAGDSDTASPDTTGSRLRAYVDDHWDRKRGGIRGLAVAINTTAETMYEWFRDEREPSLAHLRALAEAFGVRRSAIVAAMDGDEPAPALSAQAMETILAQLEPRLEALLDERVGPRRPTAARGAA